MQFIQFMNSSSSYMTNQIPLNTCTVFVDFYYIQLKQYKCVCVHQKYICEPMEDFFNIYKQ